MNIYETLQDIWPPEKYLAFGLKTLTDLTCSENNNVISITKKEIIFTKYQLILSTTGLDSPNNF